MAEPAARGGRVVGKVERAPFANWHEAVERIGRHLTDRQPLRALETSARAIRQFPHNPELLRRHAQVAEQLVADEPDHAAGYADIALRCYRRATRTDPGNPDAAAGYARMLDRSGDRAAAMAALGPHVGREPPHPEIAMVFATLAPSQGLTERAIGMLDRVLAERETIRLRHAQARLLDRAGRYEDAFAAARRGNELVAISQKANGFRPGVLTATVDAIIAATPAAAMAAAAPIDRRSELPVFIVGMGRSGTTLVEQIIAGHPQAHGAGERRAVLRATTAIARLAGRKYPSGIPHWPAEALERVHDEFVAQLQRLAPGALRIADKLPQNFMRLAVLQRLLPGARIIHTRRNPLDVCLSAYFQEQKIPAMEPWDLYRSGLCYRDYERLMTHFRAVLELPMLDVQYEELVARPEAEARRIIDFLGLPWDQSCLAVERNRRIVDTSNYESVRRPIHGEAVDRWRRYERHLEPLRRGLAGLPPE
ncbi:sulfotransferase [Stella sp.]|uniref:tetratricopeptide repeat-containing sulfotransferase family protein n=1 Tax=Stella sp. TaxID=2912054 RepID=UPI0035AF974D